METAFWFKKHVWKEILGHRNKVTGIVNKKREKARVIASVEKSHNFHSGMVSIIIFCKDGSGFHPHHWTITREEWRFLPVTDGFCLQDLLNLWRILKWGITSFGSCSHALKCIEGQLVVVKVRDSGQPKSSTTMHPFCHSEFLVLQIKSTMQEILKHWATIPTNYSGLLNQSPWITTVFLSFICFLHQFPSPDGECSSLGAPAPLSWVIKGFGSRVPLPVLVATDVYSIFITEGSSLMLWAGTYCWGHSIHYSISYAPAMNHIVSSIRNNEKA